MKVIDAFALSPMQEAFYFNSQIDEKAYIVQYSYQFDGQVNLDIFQQALNQLTKNYDILRTAFVSQGFSKPLQVVLDEREIPLVFHNLENQNAKEVDVLLENYKKKSALKHFNLSSDPLLRVSIFKLSDKKFAFVWEYHHILMDGWCINILMNEFNQVYARLSDGKSIMGVHQPSYKNFVKWIEKQDLEQANNFWNEYLKNVETNCIIPQISDPSFKNIASQNNEFAYEIKNFQALNQFCVENKITSSTFLYAVWGILLNRYNNTNDAVFGTISAVRPTEIPNIDKIIGLFINTIPVRINERENQKFKDLAKKIQKNNLEKSKYEFVSLAQISSKTDFKKDLINHLFVIDNNTEVEAGSGFVNGENNIQINYPFSVHAHFSKKLILRFTYDDQLFSSSLVRKLALQYDFLIGQILENPEVITGDLKVLTNHDEESYQRIFSNKQTFDIGETIANLVEKVVEKHPQKMAVRFQEEKLSYQEIWQKSFMLANKINNRIEKNNEVVALIADKSATKIISILAIFRSKATYLPVIPALPVERKKYILHDTQVRTILTEKKYLSSLSWFDGEIILIDEVEKSEICNKEIIGKSTTDNAYIIYTSGTTGKPKGVPIREKSFVSRTLFHTEHLQLNSNDTVLQFASNSFDASLIEIFMALTCGGCVVVPDEFTKGNLAALEKLIADYQVSTAILPPVILKSFDKVLPDCLKNIITTGEEAILDDVIYHSKTKNIYNGYGPTETCLGATFHQIKHTRKEFYQKIGKIPVGLPFADTGVWVLDSQFRIVPEGGVGEIYISGIGLSEGYLNNTELTQEKFIKNPFSKSIDDQILYKTGDLGRWSSHHGIEYCGRIDNQIQIRGIRVELGEIEAMMMKLLPIEKAVVLNVENADKKQLVGYYKAQKSQKINHSEWRNLLRKYLPDFMIPSIFMGVKDFLLTTNGKIDKSNLPKPAVVAKKNRDFTPIEKKVAAIWKELLGVKTIGLADNFFELGGHSLIAIQLSSRIFKELNKKVNVGEIFDNPTIEELSNFINNDEKIKYRPIPKVAEKPFYEASKAQSRMWILSQINQSSDYNLQACFWLNGNLNIEIFKKSLELIQARHEILNTYFADQNGKIVQIINKKATLPFDFKETRQSESEIRAVFEMELRYNFSLDSGSQWRLLLVKSGKNNFACCLTAHHSILDAWSLEILMHELAQVYNDLMLGKEIRLPKLSIQYKDFVEWQENTEQNESKNYWLEKLGGDLPILEMPTDFERPAIKSMIGKAISFELKKEDLAKFAQKNQLTIFSILVSNLNLLLRKYTGQSDIIIGTPLAQRQHPDLENQVGLYLNTLCLRLSSNKSLSISELLKNSKQTIEGAFENQNYAFDNLVDDLGIRRQADRMPIFSVMISHTGATNTKNDSFKEISIKDFPKSDEVASKFDLEWFFSESQDSIHCQLIYDVALFNKKTTENLIRHFQELLSELIAQESQPKNIEMISILSEDEKSFQLENFSKNQGQDSFEINNVFISEFEKIALKNQNKLIFYENGNTSTYGQVNAKANQYARYLSENYSIQGEKIVGILSERSSEFIISILALQKLGVAFLPIDMNIPSERVRFICEDAGVSFILTSPNCTYEFDELREQNIIFYDDFLWQRFDSTNLQIKHNLNDLAYLIYTSGSTGTPKGVMISNENLMNYLLWANQYYFKNQADQAFAFFTSISFDLTITSVFSPLLRADIIHIFSDSQPINEVLEEIFDEKSRIKTVKLTPSHINAISKIAGNLKAKVEIAIVGGEELRQEHIRILKEINPEIKIYNEYGPTETTVGCTVELIENYDSQNKISIGKPIANTEIYVLDENLQMLPVGAKGEIYVGGKGVGQGYLNNKVLSEEKFLDNPFIPNQKMYRTGDLAVWLENGKLSYYGRIDNQVKIDGHRIEIGEVERKIEQILEVQHTAIKIRKEKNEQQMVAFVQVSKSPSTKEVRQRLRGFLPNYMIPSQFVFLENLPINRNGKVDYSKLTLPIPTENNLEDFGKPKNQIEEKLILLYTKILNQPNISFEEDFFDLGGNSIKAFELINEIRKEFDIKLNLKDIFHESSIRQIALKIDLAEWVTEKSDTESILLEI